MEGDGDDDDEPLTSVLECRLKPYSLEKSIFLPASFFCLRASNDDIFDTDSFVRHKMMYLFKSNQFDSR